MPLNSSLTSTPAVSSNPASSNKIPRPRLRGFSYLRSHTHSSSQSHVPLSTPSTLDTGRSIRSVNNQANPSLQYLGNQTASPNTHSPTEAEQQAYLSRLESYFLPSPPDLARSGASRTMARNRSGSTPNGVNALRKLSDTSSSLIGLQSDQMPTIRFIQHQDPRSNRPSLAFPATARTLPHEDCIIRVGRYSERDTNPNPPPNMPSSAPVGFKSKVVSRRHCEFWCSQGQWYIKDVKSSSGTFLNHIRLSQPSVESKPFPVHDGDVVQLGIDFRGGEEMIFRCVKIRVECNRGWQKTLNNYNVTTHKRLRDLGKPSKKDSDATSTHSSECSICLMSIAPCQSLFVAPCSHVWHYKCIRPILVNDKSYPQFLCPNCRAVTDLEADVDDIDGGNWEDEENDTGSNPDVDDTRQTNGIMPEHNDFSIDGVDEALSNATMRSLTVNNIPHSAPTMITSSDPNSESSASPSLLTRRGARRIEPSFPPITAQSATRTASGPAQYLRPITPTRPLMGEDIDDTALRTPTQTDMLLHDGPMTPTNNAGPFVFDGSAGRIGGHRMGSSLSDSTDNASLDS
ncbi:hypothetical protein N7G274_000029 [Stereocaulon virgatum]|uniref:SMAD/FHA domain-containing protein n=1 Tax=Stereocaulon virgatum TaxID=373712 RepID=A0ABR4AQY2_9LECA